MPARLRIEIFAADLDATARFYVHGLSFRIEVDERYAETPYVSLRRDDVLIGARQVQEAVDHRLRRVPVGTEIVLEVDDVADEYRRYVSLGFHADEGLRTREWGLVDFRLVDPDGYYIRVTSRPAG